MFIKWMKKLYKKPEVKMLTTSILNILAASGPGPAGDGDTPIVVPAKEEDASAITTHSVWDD